MVRDRLPRLLGRVAEWQTRWLQVPVSFGTWGFKSPFAHNCHELQIPRPLAGVFVLLGLAPVIHRDDDVAVHDGPRCRILLEHSALVWIGSGHDAIDQLSHETAT